MPKYIQIKDRRHQRACSHQTPPPTHHLMLSHWLAVQLSSPLSPSLSPLFSSHSSPNLSHFFPNFPSHFSCLYFPIRFFTIFQIPLPPSSLSPQLLIPSSTLALAIVESEWVVHCGIFFLAHIPPNSSKHCRTSQSLAIQVILYFTHSRKLRSHNARSYPSFYLILSSPFFLNSQIT